jgi:hypothetical protein
VLAVLLSFILTPMNALDSTATAGWFPVLTFLLGFAAKFVSDFVQRKHELERDRETRRETRRDQLAQQRRSFQRETLLALQESVNDMMRATHEAHHKDEMAFRSTGKWQKQLLSEELNERYSLTVRRTAILGVRVRDSLLRELCEKIRALSAQTIMSPDRDTSNAASNTMIPMFEDIQQRVGALLRTLDDEETNDPALLN